MKKIATLTLMCILALTSFTGCTSKMLKLTQNNIAEVRYNIYAGTGGTIHATFMSGMREKNYVVNGYATELIPFGVLTFTLPDTENTKPEQATYILKYGTTRYEGELEVNPFDGTYVADIKQVIDDTASLDVEVVMGNTVQNITLNKVNSDWKVDHAKALKIATKKCDAHLKKYVVDNYFEGEVYIKIINEPNTPNYYWYVSFLNRNATNVAALIDPISGDCTISNK